MEFGTDTWVVVVVFNLKGSLCLQEGERFIG